MVGHDYGTDVETLIVDSLPEAFHGRHTDWRQRARALIEGVEARGGKIVPVSALSPAVPVDLLVLCPHGGVLCYQCLGDKIIDYQVAQGRLR